MPGRFSCWRQRAARHPSAMCSVSTPRAPSPASTLPPRASALGEAGGRLAFAL